MESTWHVVYYQTEKGVSELRDFVESRKDQEQQKILAWITLLEEKGPQVPRPYADLLRDGIHELRIKLTGPGAGPAFLLLPEHRGFDPCLHEDHV